MGGAAPTGRGPTCLTWRPRPSRPRPGLPPRADRRPPLRPQGRSSGSSSRGGPAGFRGASGQRALEGASVGGRAVGRENVLDRQFEQRAQRLEDLFGRHTLVRAQSAGNSWPSPRSMSVSPARSARRLSTQSTRPFGSMPGNASTPLPSGWRRFVSESVCDPG